MGVSSLAAGLFSGAAGWAVTAPGVRRRSNIQPGPEVDRFTALCVGVDRLFIVRGRSWGAWSWPGLVVVKPMRAQRGKSGTGRNRGELTRARGERAEMWGAPTNRAKSMSLFH